MKKLVCGAFGTIYYAQILKNGLMSSTNRVDVTDEAILAVLNHLMSPTDYGRYGYFGYEWPQKNVCMMAYDPRKYVLVERKNQ